MINVVVVDDHKIVRDGLCKLLSDQMDIKVMASVATGDAAMILLNQGLAANMLLTDLNMPIMDGLELTRQALAFRKNLRIIVLTFQPLIAVKPYAIAAGAKACLSKDGDLDELLTAMRAVHAASL
jgi:DNA-binding NarL/FixJ family response regulator